MYIKRTKAKEFKNSLTQSKYKQALTSYTIKELASFKLYKDNRKNIGYALINKTNYIDIVSVHNNSGQKGLAQKILKSAIRQAKRIGKKDIRLDCIDGVLVKIYKKAGFVEIRRECYNPIYDTNGEIYKVYGASDIVYMQFKAK